MNDDFLECSQCYRLFTNMTTDYRIPTCPVCDGLLNPENIDFSEDNHVNTNTSN